MQIMFKDVHKIYRVGEKDIPALNGVDFSINSGELAVILGPSGAGKSTILNLLGGMDTATSGKIIVNGDNVTNLREGGLTDYRAEKIGFVFQFYNLIPTITAFENVALTKELIPHALEPRQVLSSVGLGEHVDKFPAQLSGGEQQRVSIARALCKNADILLCDEPTGALDSETGTTILILLQELCRKSGKTVIIVTHNSAIAEAADKVIKVKNGKIREIRENSAPISMKEVQW